MQTNTLTLILVISLVVVSTNINKGKQQKTSLGETAYNLY